MSLSKLSEKVLTSFLCDYEKRTNSSDTLQDEGVRVAVFEYIYCFYNVKRTQKRLGYLSFKEYVRSLETKRLKAVA